jgi:hypothetical protein
MGPKARYCFEILPSHSKPAAACQPPRINAFKPVSNHLQNPEFIATLAVLLAGAALFGAMAWAERRPRTSFTPSLIPTTPVMLAGLLLTIIALVHLLNLLGIRTGR